MSVMTSFLLWIVGSTERLRKNRIQSAICLHIFTNIPQYKRKGKSKKRFFLKKDEKNMISAILMHLP